MSAPWMSPPPCIGSLVLYRPRPVASLGVLLLSRASETGFHSGTTPAIPRRVIGAKSLLLPKAPPNVTSFMTSRRLRLHMLIWYLTNDFQRTLLFLFHKRRTKPPRPRFPPLPPRILSSHCLITRLHPRTGCFQPASLSKDQVLLPPYSPPKALLPP